ncbi:MAG: transposase, partial [Clostridiales bacterium]
VKPDIDIKDVYNAIKSVSHERGEFVMTIAEKLINEGIEKGIEKGKLETAIEMKKLGSDIEFISKVTKISIKVLKKEIFKDE